MNWDLFFTPLLESNLLLENNCILKNMAKPLSDDLRWRLIYQRLFYAKRYNDIASQLFVSARTVLKERFEHS